ncbi:MAG: 2-oxo acid dehydrogenase subunit E2 [Planctomycetaceae bacterium]|nr:2-oxo acid dehydrogenase subunit E2 [Planctomycetaceae bacterium]
MLNKITMPSAGQNTDKFTIIRWVKSVGDPVTRGDVLLEVETDKATLPVESFAKGTLLQVFFNDGDTVTAGDVIALVGEKGDAEEAPSTPVPAETYVATQDTESDAGDDYVPIQPSAPGSAATPHASASVKNAPPAFVGEKIQASPAAKKSARDRSISLAQIAAATGKTRIKAADVAAFENHNGGQVCDILPISSMRKTIATRMLASTTSIPSYTVEVEVDMTALQELREHSRQTGTRMAYHDLFAKCVATAIADHPLINASYTDDGIILHQKINVGIAVALEEGLIVPVVKDVAAKRLGAIAAESAALVEKARSGKLAPNEMQEGTITISNLGSFPVSRFTAIINPPETCILAIGGIMNRPTIQNGNLVERPIVTITATFDHRLIDGAYGAAFLADLKGYIEAPASML